MSTSSSLCMVTPYFVKMNTLPSSHFLPALISEVGNSSNVSASAALLKSCGNGSGVKYLPLHHPTSSDSAKIGVG